MSLDFLKMLSTAIFSVTTYVPVVFKILFMGLSAAKSTIFVVSASRNQTMSSKISEA